MARSLYIHTRARVTRATALITTIVIGSQFPARECFRTMGGTCELHVLLNNDLSFSSRPPRLAPPPPPVPPYATRSLLIAVTRPSPTITTTVDHRVSSRSDPLTTRRSLPRGGKIVHFSPAPRSREDLRSFNRRDEKKEKKRKKNTPTEASRRLSRAGRPRARSNRAPPDAKLAFFHARRA